MPLPTVYQDFHALLVQGCISVAVHHTELIVFVGYSPLHGEKEPLGVPRRINIVLEVEQVALLLHHLLSPPQIPGFEIALKPKGLLPFINNRECLGILPFPRREVVLLQGLSGVDCVGEVGKRRGCLY